MPDDPRRDSPAASSVSVAFDDEERLASTGEPLPEPYVAAADWQPEATLKAVLAGILFGILF
ncbi:MAG: hypothetical protein P8174_10330, partial [Gemmatimonadota bacterium]